MIRRFTGWHMTAILVGFFAVVIAVNFTMARLASSTFGGALAENGYVASQNYNRWVRDADKQAKLGWSLTTSIRNERLSITTNFQPQRLDVRLIHPLGLVDERALVMVPQGDRLFKSAQIIPAGRWKVLVTASRGRDRADYIQEVRR